MQVSVGNEQRLTPVFLENAGKLLCAVDEQVLRRISADDIKYRLLRPSSD